MVGSTPKAITHLAMLAGRAVAGRASGFNSKVCVMMRQGQRLPKNFSGPKTHRWASEKS